MAHLSSGGAVLRKKILMAAVLSIAAATLARIGAAEMLGALLLAGGLTVAIRRRPDHLVAAYGGTNAGRLR
jgi:hypothetical protein